MDVSFLLDILVLTFCIVFFLWVFRSSKDNLEMEMPKSIRIFEGLFLGSFYLGLIKYQIAFDWVPRNTDINGEPLVLFKLDHDYYLTFFAYLLLCSTVLFTTRKKSLIGKYLVVSFFLFGLFEWTDGKYYFDGDYHAWPWKIPGIFDLNTMGNLAIIQTLMQICAIYLLINKSSKSWFKSKGM